MHTTIENRDGFGKILGRLTTLALIGLMVLALVALPHSIKIKAKSGWAGPSRKMGTFVQNVLDDDSHL